MLDEDNAWLIFFLIEFVFVTSAVVNKGLFLSICLPFD